ncbi:hypothetical protein J2X14_000266 [Pantoea alhagi]|uniref:hypothetical protein n=1 Tax=Mixta sp. BE291 TaxID=3158787 RepID=UPI002865EDAB|nr:hypothetical protein [Pantoea alhagi]
MRLNHRLSCALSLLVLFSAQAEKNRVPPAVENIIQHQFPVNRAELQRVTETLFTEYQQQKNVTSLMFYAYGTLKLAAQRAEENDMIGAAEYARAGFFWLDEAAERNETDARVRYLRARIDAFLPASAGRCVIALSDTQFILNSAQTFPQALRSKVKYMRYRALVSCGQEAHAHALLNQLKQESPRLTALALAPDATPDWDISEATQIVLPLAEGK